MMEQLVAELVDRNTEAIEEACAYALKLGYGVQVFTYPDATIHAIVDPKVPAGEIHYRDV